MRVRRDGRPGVQLRARDVSHHTGSEAVIRLRDRCLSSRWAWTSAIARTTRPFAWRSGWTPPAESPIYHLRHLKRFRLGTSYPAVVERVGEMLAGPPLWGCRQLVVDGTGVGAPVVDMFRQKGLVPIAITITGGDTVTGERGNYRVPKRYLVSTCKSCCRPGC